MSNDEIKVTFVRHGRSEGDDLKIHEGRYDAELTEVGHQQAQVRATSFWDEQRGYDLILSSSLRRASKVASIFAETLRLDVEYRDNLREMDNGSIAGLPFDIAEQQFPTPDFINPYQPKIVSADDGESRTELFSRAALEVQNIVRRGAGNYLVISHGGFINATMSVICGIAPSANQQPLLFALGDLALIDTVYYPQKHLWVIKRFDPGFLNK